MPQSKMSILFMVTNKDRLTAAAKAFACGLLTVTILFGVFDYTLLRMYYYRVKVPGGSIGIRI